MKKYQSYINKLKDHLSEHNESRFLAQQLLRLHKETELKINPLIVELGVDRGQSTKVFLNAIDGKKMLNLFLLTLKIVATQLMMKIGNLFSKTLLI